MISSFSSRCTVLAALLAVALAPVSATAQGSDYDPEYDDEEAAGVLSYDDEEAAGGYDEDMDVIGEEEGDYYTPIDDEGDDAWVSGELGASAEIGADDEATPESEEEGPDLAARDPWEWGAHRHHSTLTGSTGLLHLTEAGSGPAGTFGLSFHGGYFKYDDYLVYGDTNTNMWGGVNLRITPLDFLEIHYGIQTSANYNDKEYPTLFQALGDMDLGIKGYYTVDWWTFGLDVGVFFLNSVGEVAMDWSGTSVSLDALSTFNFTEIEEKAPIRIHILAGYMFDNSANLIEGIEEENGGCGMDSDGTVRNQGCLSPVERTALGIDRNDQFRLGLGVDALFPYVSPMIEYRLEVPVNRQDFTCPQDSASADSCMVEEGSAGFRQILTFGVRILPPLDDLAFDIGVDLGLSGYAPTVHELAAEVPYRVLFGATYNFDPLKEPPPPPPVPEPIVIEPPPPPAVIAGLVHDGGSVDTPVPDAVVTYLGQDLNAQITGEDGRFTSYALPPGAMALAVSAEGYHEGSFTVDVPETGLVEQAFPLEALPKKAVIAVTVIDDKGNPVGTADVSLEHGGISGVRTTDSNGKFETEVSEEGEYNLVADVEGFLSKRMKIDALFDERVEVTMQLRTKPKRSLVVVKEKRIVIKRKIHFATDSDVIEEMSFALLDEVADTLINHPEIRLVEIQGHTDDRGKRDYNVDLSERRARAVMRHLTSAGVERSRLEARGFGPDRPVAPNITKNGRSRNRRVEFHITERSD